MFGCSRIRRLRFLHAVAAAVLAAYVVNATGFVPHVVANVVNAMREVAAGSSRLSGAPRGLLPSFADVAASRTPTDTCATDGAVAWVNHEPIFDPSIPVDFGPCQVVMVSSRTMHIPGTAPCDAGSDGVCVLVMATSARAHLDVSGLDVSWWGTARTTIDRAIADKIRDPDRGWFSPANCGGTCRYARVFILDESGRLDASREIERP